MAIEHNVIEDPEIHEPKGVRDAAADLAYISNGSGSGVWAAPWTSVSSANTVSYGSCGGTGVNLGMTANYQEVTGTGWVAQGTLTDFTQTGLGRLTYTGATTKDFLVTIVCDGYSDNASDLTMSILLGGGAVGTPMSLPGFYDGTAVYYSMGPGSITARVTMSTNQYLSIGHLSDGAGDRTGCNAAIHATSAA